MSITLPCHPIMDWQLEVDLEAALYAISAIEESRLPSRLQTSAMAGSSGVLLFSLWFGFLAANIHFCTMVTRAIEYTAFFLDFRQG